jgi:hypothetical protein
MNTNANYNFILAKMGVILVALISEFKNFIKPIEVHTDMNDFDIGGVFK